MRAVDWKLRGLEGRPHSEQIGMPAVDSRGHLQDHGLNGVLSSLAPKANCSVV